MKRKSFIYCSLLIIISSINLFTGYGTEIENQNLSTPFSTIDTCKNSTSENKTKMSPSSIHVRIPFKYNGKYGYLDENLKVAITPKYTEASNYKDGYAIIRNNSMQRCVIDTNGKVILSTESRITHLFDDFFACEGIGEDISIINVKTKKILIDGLGEIPYSGDNNTIMVRQISSYRTYIDANGKELFSNLGLNRETWPFSEGRAIVGFIDDGATGIINTDGKVIKRGGILRILGGFSEGLIPVQLSDKTTGYMDRNGNMAFTVPFYYDDWLMAESFKNGYALVKPNRTSGWRVINKTGSFVSDEINADYVYPFFENKSLVRKFNNKTHSVEYGFVNTDGSFFIPIVLSNAKYFSDGYAQITYQKRDGIIDTIGNVYWSDDLVNGIIGGEKFNFSD